MFEKWSLLKSGSIDCKIVTKVADKTNCSLNIQTDE